jgi:hypothetical protein
MKRNGLLLAAVLLSLPACTRSVPTATNGPPTEAAATNASCKSEQFVACPTGETCTRRGGKLVRSLACYEHAADACAAAGCKFGCDVHHGEPKEVHCAINAASTGNMKKCGGYSNWACPENTTCDLGPTAERGYDVMGDCVPIPP